MSLLAGRKAAGAFNLRVDCGLSVLINILPKRLGKKGIRSNAICPGFIETPILKSMPHKVVQMMEEKVPMGRLGTLDELAHFSMAFVDGTSRFVTGQFVPFAGGWV